MSDSSANLVMPYLVSGQDHADRDHNTAVEELDALVMCMVKDRDSSSPGSGANGDRYIVKSTGSGAWAGLDNNIVMYVDGQWKAYDPVVGWCAYVEDEKCVVRWDGTSWKSLVGEAIFGAHKHGSSQSLSSSFAGITFDVETRDICGAFTHSTSSNTDRVTLNEAGDYHVMGSITFDYTSGTNNPCEVQLSLDGSAVQGSLAHGFVSSTIDKCTVVVNQVITATAGQILRLEGRVTAGGASALLDATRIVVRRV